MKDKIRIVIADDHPIFRQGLRQVVEKDAQIQVIAEAENGEAAVTLIQTHQPEIALLDLDMPLLDGFAVVRRLRDLSLATRVIFLTMHEDELHFNEALDLGVQGYLIKDSAAADVVHAIQAVTAGKRYISPTLSTFLLDRTQRAATLSAQQPGLRLLTQTERRVLALLAEYKTSKEIAALLGVSTRTIENHRANICVKLELHGTHALVKFALDHKSELA